MNVTWLPAAAARSTEPAPPPEGRPASFFVGPHWFRTCLATWPPDGSWRIARIQYAGDAAPVLGFVGEATTKRYRMVRSRTLALNESLHPGLDETYVEMNGFHGAPAADFETYLDALLTDLLKSADWDELKLSGLLPDAASAARAIAAKRGLAVHVANHKPTYWVDLDTVRREQGGDFLAGRSANTRQQVRRAMRALEKDLGPAALERAATPADAREWFLAAGPHHRARWTGTPGAVYGGFDNPDFVRFHTTLIEQSFDAGAIHMTRVRAGDRVFAYLYNFFDTGCASFYLSGIDYTVGEKYKPGIVAHVLAIEQYLAEGASKYDFMAGANRYKASLATHESTQEWLVLQRPRLMLKAEALARRLKGAWRNRGVASAPAEVPSASSKA